MSETIATFLDESFLEHDPGPGHPERVERLQVVRGALGAEGPASLEWTAPGPAAREDVERVHERHYVELVSAQRGKSVWLDPDTALSPGSVDAAWKAAGAGVEAVRGLVKGDYRRAFVLPRPPGHHAERARARGFCVFSNLAIAAAHARAELGIERLLVVDWDVHHGNGTQHAFEADPGVLFFDTHQHPLFPGSGLASECGVGQGAGYTVNLPLPPGTRDADLAKIYEDWLGPLADEYRPQLVLVSAGFDGHLADPVGSMRLSVEGFAHLCSETVKIAEKHAEGRLALFLEGGYDLAALGACSVACARVLGGVTAPRPTGDASEAALRILAEARACREQALG